MNDIDTSALVYDRTNADTYDIADINRVAEFCETVVNAALAEISALATMRATYDVAASEYSLPDYTAEAITVKKDYAHTDTYTIAQMQQYLANAVYVIAKFPPAELATMPQNMRYLTAALANAIEHNLQQSAENLVARSSQTETNIKNTAAAFAYSGEIFAGGII